MTSTTRRYGVALMAAAFLGALAAPAASAETFSEPVPAIRPAADVRMDNLRWVLMRTMSGGTVWLLRVAADPGVEPGRRYFLWNPDTSSRPGGFAVGDDVQVATVGSWQSAIFRRPYTVRRVEVRYGDPRTPETAVVVASFTSGRAG
ncbi:hypothetical protein ACFV16_38325 [Streptomyces massasporeus]|uniref:hypothetical protein n=1 Tax=Streptomyces massasporeus TaxID=67324 RepID=UPI00369F1D65